MKSVDKPGSVVEQSFIWDKRHRLPQATYPDRVRATRRDYAITYDLYLVLLRVGFSLPRLLPAVRYALTVPFHPYLAA